MADLVAARRARLAALRERGVDPFGATRYEVTAHAAELAAKYAGLEEQGRAEDVAWSLAGRIMSARGQGKVIFFDLHDRTGRFQLFVRQNDVGEEAFALAKEIERGDIAGATGFVFRTKTGELTVEATKFVLLTKALRPLPSTKVHTAGANSSGYSRLSKHAQTKMSPNDTLLTPRQNWRGCPSPPTTSSLSRLRPGVR